MCIGYMSIYYYYYHYIFFLSRLENHYDIKIALVDFYDKLIRVGIFYQVSCIKAVLFVLYLEVLQYVQANSFITV